MNRKPEKFVDLQVRAPVDPGEVMAALSQHDPLGAWENEGLVHLYWHEAAWNPQILVDLRAGLGGLGIDPDQAEIEIVSVPDQDWNLKWAENIQPIRVGRNILIRQSWNPPDLPFAGITLILDPKQAFGSGYHATTQLLIEFLEDRIKGGEEVLDVGTGSGILTMVALRLGARRALGIDIDPVAVDCARENALNNGFGCELELSVALLEEVARHEFDLVLANLDRRSLLGYFARFKMNLKPGGRALCSGLLLEDWEDIAASLMLCGGEVCERRERDEWMALEIRY
jgi:ribosomal protein L11 methyltransferase